MLALFPIRTIADHVLGLHAHSSQVWNSMVDTAWKRSSRSSRLDELVTTIASSEGLMKAVAGSDNTQIWEPEVEVGEAAVEPSIYAHIRSLGLIRVFPTVPGPPMALHRLGSFGDDPVLRKRVDNIFCGRNKFLVNTSGTGKTRLLYEGLCRNWGLYFTSIVDSTRLGMNDIYPIVEMKLLDEPEFTSVLSSSETEPAERLARNLQLAHRHFSIILLVRLLALQMFIMAAVANGVNDSQKQIWLKLQLCYPFESVDIPFEKIYTSVKAMSDRVIEDGIAETLKEIFTIQDIGPAYFVLDEANFVSHALREAFRDDDGKHYSVIKVMLRVWIGHLKRLPLTFVVAGTEIPREYFAGEEWADWLWSSDTGAFDNKEVQRQYVTSFLPPEIVSTEDGQRLVERNWKWLRGSFLHLTSLAAQGATGRMTVLSILAMLGRRPSIKLTLNSSMKLKMKLASWLHEALLFSLVNPSERAEFTLEAIGLITESFGRFIDPDCTEITVDEPVILAGAANHFGEEPRSLLGFDYFCDHILVPDIGNQHVAAYMSLCMAATFDAVGGRPMGDLFVLPKSCHTWASASAEIFFRRIKGKRKSEVAFRYSQDLSQELVTWSFEPDATVTWLRSHKTPFCIQVYNEVVTVIFALKTSNGEYFWVFLCMLRPADENQDLLQAAKKAASSLHPQNLFRFMGSTSTNAMIDKALQGLPGTCPDFIGESRVLRVVGSFSQHISISSLRSDKTSRITILNTQPIRTATQSYPSDALITRLLSNANDNDTPKKRKQNNFLEDNANRAGKCVKKTRSSADNTMKSTLTQPRSKKGASIPENKVANNA
uniref:Uncharacterized protein n=1 Tax=Moniliophthora roreri TaxID=221103 RepID=A0A0W0FPR5_MONRR